MSKPRTKPGDRQALLVESVRYWAGECSVVYNSCQNEGIIVSEYETEDDFKRDFPDNSLVVIQATDQFEHFIEDDHNRPVLKRSGPEAQRIWKLVRE